MTLLSLVQLDWASDRRPTQLSGGQRQRIARARAVEPRVLLLDEPFGALDAQVRRELRRWLRRLHDELHVTSVFVTHDQEEALGVADRVVQEGTPDAVYDAPATPFVYGFLGTVNRFDGRVADGHMTAAAVRVSAPDHAETDATLFVRPQDVDLVRTGGGGATEGAAIAGVLREVRTVGTVARLSLAPAIGGDDVEVEMSRERFDAGGWQRGDAVCAVPRRYRIFPAA